MRKGAQIPFDVQHRKIISYTPESPRDFEQLKDGITEVLRAQLRKQEMRGALAATPVKSTEGLEPHEIAILALIMANRDAPDDGVATFAIKQDMRRALYTDVATSIGLTGLTRKNYLIPTVQQQGYDEYHVYRLTAPGEDWLLHNIDKLQLRQQEAEPEEDDSGITDDDVPF